MLNFIRKKRSRKIIRSSEIISRINLYLSENYTPHKASLLDFLRDIARSTSPSLPISHSEDAESFQTDMQHSMPEEDSFETDAFCSFFQFDELLRLSRPAEEIDIDLDAALEMSFVDKLLSYISEKKLRDTQVYKAAHIDRKLFSKIASNRRYTPAKDTCLALCFALHLSLEETTDLLSRAEHALTHSNKRDIVIEYLIRERVYDLFDVNEILHHLGMKTLGS